MQKPHPRHRQVLSRRNAHGHKKTKRDVKRMNSSSTLLVLLLLVWRKFRKAVKVPVRWRTRVPRSLCTLSRYSLLVAFSAVREAGRDADARLAKQIDRSTPLSPTSLSSVFFFRCPHPVFLCLVWAYKNRQTAAQRERELENTQGCAPCARESHSRMPHAHTARTRRAEERQRAHAKRGSLMGRR